MFFFRVESEMEQEMEQTKSQPKVSILIPVYNTASYLPKCFASVMNQTLKEIEIIAVNDASPDNAAEVLAEYAAKDNRVKVLTHEKNGGILAARLTGIAAATGEYLIFLDADDYLDTDTARACYAKAKQTGADMIHFCFDVRIGHKKKTHFSRKVEKRINPYRGKLLGKEVFEAAFVKYLYSWNIAGKCIAAEVCRKAAASLPPGYYIMAEDFCFYSMLSWFSTHYEPLFKKCYYYGLNIGVSTYERTDYQGFQRKCTIFAALNAVKNFLKAQGAFDHYREAYEIQERHILGELLDRWDRKLIQYDRIRALVYMFRNYPAPGLIRTLIDCFADKEDRLAALMGDPNSFAGNRNPAEIHHIGLYLDPAVNGTEYVSHLLCYAEEWKRQGLEVSIISPEAELPNPDDKMNRIRIPAGLTDAPEKLVSRINFWFELGEKYGIDAVAHGALESPRSLFDALSIRFSKLKLLAFPLTVRQLPADASLGYLMTKVRCFQLSDLVALLNPGDQAFLAAIGLPGTVIPPAWKPMQQEKVPSRKGEGLLWLGHFGLQEAEIAVSAWAKLLQQFPGCRLHMAGRDRFPNSDRSVHLAAAMMNADDLLETSMTPAVFTERLKNCALFFTTSAEPDVQIYARAAAAAGVPFLQSGSNTPEELADALADMLRGKSSGTGFSPSSPQDDAIQWKDILMKTGSSVNVSSDLPELLSSYLLRFEPYTILPEKQGSSFIKVYRKLDSLVYRLLPAGSRCREKIYEISRYLFNRFKLGEQK